MIVSVLALLNVIFVPIYDVWGGLFPSDVNRTFWDFITGKCSSAQWVFMFMLAIFVCSLLMFIFSVARLTLPARLSAAAGILWVGFRLFQYFDQFDFDFDYIFGDFDSISFSIGFWIALLLFLVMLFLPSKKRTVIG